MMDSNLVYRAAVAIVPLVIAIVFHEVAHGWAARALGDPTAYEQRRLSFNPLRHVDPMGTIVVPLGLALAGAPVFGWAKPVPVDSRRLREPRTGMMLVALAGPGMNLLLALAASVLLGVLVGAGLAPDGFVGSMLVEFILVDVFIALFNLLPIPPFDGSHVLEGLLPRPLARRYADLRQAGFALVILLVVVLPMVAPRANLVGRVVLPPARWLAGLFFGLAHAVG
ncbi:site-2 protease family protein [Sphingomonas bacterium]|uniref:site-2 protease family protein n=1 Tax=Sphingomonas bacterium TaxID=1895847 RepID=UPI0015755253|nr:site-2 protease family protein [Sphingomonas bacterium]